MLLLYAFSKWQFVVTLQFICECLDDASSRGKKRSCASTKTFRTIHQSHVSRWETPANINEPSSLENLNKPHLNKKASTSMFNSILRRYKWYSSSNPPSVFCVFSFSLSSSSCLDKGPSLSFGRILCNFFSSSSERHTEGQPQVHCLCL